LEEAVAILKKDNVVADFYAGDIRKIEDCKAAVDKAVQSFGSLDILVNSAAGNFLAAADELSVNGFRTVMDIDAQGMFNITRTAFPHLKVSKFGGVVTSITATLHYTATWYQGAPVAAKAAIEALSRTMALEWGEFGIRVNCVAPGPIADTPGMEKLSGGKPESAAVLDRVPLRRAGTKEEIGMACIFLCLNKYITGDTMNVDGGEWFGSRPSLPREKVSKVSRGVEGGSRAMGPSSKL